MIYLEEVEYSGNRNHYGPATATPDAGEGSPYVVVGAYDYLGEAGYRSDAATAVVELSRADGAAWSDPATVVLLALEAEGSTGAEMEPTGGCNILNLGGTAATSLLPIFLAFIALRRWRNYK